MNKRNVIIPSVLALIIVAIIFISVKVIKKYDKDENIERNYGISYTETKITSNGLETTNPEEAIPQKEQLLKNLEDKGYDIEYYDTVFDSEIYYGHK